MKNWQKLSLALIAILILVVIGVSLLVKSYLLPETIEVFVIPKLEEIIKHEISFKEIEVGFTGTVKLKNISIYDPTLQKESIFFQSQDIVLHCQLLPLLLKKVIIVEEITLHQPDIELVRDEQGNCNFIKDAPEATKKASDKGKADNVPSKTTLSFIVTHLNIKNGKFTFTDYFKTPSKPFQFKVRNINVHASDLSPLSSFPIDISAEIVSTPPSFLKLKGSIDPLRKEAETKIQLAPLDITYFSPCFPDLPFTLLEGFCSLDLNITANSSLDFSSQGLISLKDLTISSVNTLDDEPSDNFTNNLRNITLELDHRLSYQSDSDTLLLEKCDATIQKAKLSLNGKILFNNHDEIIIEHLRTTLKDSSLTLKGKINHYPDEPLTAELQFSSPSLVIDDIISCLEEVKVRRERTQEEEEEEKKEKESDEMEPLNLKGVKIKTDISLGNIIYKNLHILDLKARCSLDDNIFNLESLKGDSEGGSFKLKGRTNLAVKGLDYNLQFTGNGLQLNPIITSFAPNLQENINGIADLTMDLRGSGTTSETFKKHLKGKGSIHIKDGEISALESLQSFASFIKVEKLDTLSFDQSKGTFNITDGVVHTKSSLKGKEIELYPEGTISLDSYLDLSLEMKISPKLSEQIATSALTKYFKDERGWTVIALSIKGPTDEIAVIPASSTIRNISEMIVDILLKKEDVDSDKRQDKKKALEDLIKGLIKKSKEDPALKSSQ
jgi:uncharacterized protein involved in outer membrane biogenesis